MATTDDALRLNQQATGSNDNVWGQVLNQQLALLATGIAGTQRIVLASNDYELSTANGAADESRAAVLDLQGNPSEELNVVVPNVSKIYLVRNNTTSDFPVTVRTLLGSGVKVRRDDARWVYSDGDSVYFAASAEDSRKAGGMIPGDVIPRNVNATDANAAFEMDTLLDRENMDARYVQSSGISAVGNFTTGDVKLTFKQTEEGWVRMNDTTIGPTNSGATGRANDDTKALYVLLWGVVSQEWAEVSGGRGATAENDYTEGKPMALPKALGRALAAAGSGDALSSRALGEALGEEKHTMTEGELVAHSHRYHRYGSGSGAAGAQNDDSGAFVQTGETGGGEPFNVMQPTLFINLLVKL